MWHSLEAPWRAAFEQAWLAYCAGSLPIGAVIIDEQGRLLSQGRNRLGENSLPNHRMAHAEMEALTNLDTSRYPDVKSYRLYTTMEPCPMCLGAIVMSNLRTVHIAARDGHAGAAHLASLDPYIRAKSMTIAYGVPELEAVQLTLHAYRELERMGGARPLLLDTFERDAPQAITLASAWYATKALKQFESSGMGAVFDAIVSALRAESMQINAAL